MCAYKEDIKGDEVNRSESEADQLPSNVSPPVPKYSHAQISLSERSNRKSSLKVNTTSWKMKSCVLYQVYLLAFGVTAPSVSGPPH